MGIKVNIREAQEFVKGLWFEFESEEYVGPEPDPEKHCIKVARDQNRVYQGALDINRKELRLSNPRQAKKVKTEKWTDATAKAMSKAILLDFNCFDDPETGEPLNGKDQTVRYKVLRENPGILEKVGNIASDFEMWDKIVLEGDVDVAPEEDPQAGKESPGAQPGGEPTPLKTSKTSSG